MSRRHTSTFRATSSRTLVGMLATILGAAALLPAAAVAQNDNSITPRMIQHEWQLLTQRDDRGNLEDVPAGVGATMLMRSGAAFGEAACSTYDSSYEQAANTLSVFVEPDEIAWRECDPESRAFDEQFYDNLSQVASIRQADDVLRVNDVIGDPLMVFTRAQIENDPTASRWILARIADGTGASEPVIRGLDPWMEFLVGGSIVGDTGCGRFLGKYDINEGRVDITDVDYRLVTCTDGAQDQAERILATLGEVTDFQVRPAGLALEDENGIIRLALEPELDVSSRTWTPTAIYGPDGKQQFGGGNELTTSAIQFRGRDFEGRSICRPFLGRALRSGLAISINSPKFVGPYCKGKVNAGQLGDIEASYITALEEAASYALRGDELTLTDVNGVRRAVLEPQPPLTGTTWTVFRMNIGKGLSVPKTNVPITATFEDIDAATIGVVQGNTGVANADGENEFFGTYDTPYATRIEVLELRDAGKGCDSKANRNRPPCKAQQRFLKLLQEADGFIVRDEDLKFYNGRKNTIVMRPLRVDQSDE